MFFSEVLNFRHAIYKIIRHQRLKLKAKLSKKVFACRALQGDSDYNICINSDMSVSCNCQDYDGSGHIGELSRQSFSEVFFGPVAQGFRVALSRCLFPVTTCSLCNDFLLINRNEVGRYLNEPKLPQKGVMVENTVSCNLSCLGCDRLKLAKTRNCTGLPIGGIEYIANELCKMNVRKISFFNLGEPFLSPNVSKEIRVLREINPEARITTSTNGCFLDTEEKIESALLLDHIDFSIDGCDQKTLSQYQVGGNFERSYHNLKKLITIRNKRMSYRTVIEWKYVLFRWNDHPHHIKRAIDLAKEANVDIISFWPGGATIDYRSYRYKYHPFYKTLGTKCSKGCEIDFRKP